MVIRQYLKPLIFGLLFVVLFFIGLYLLLNCQKLGYDTYVSSEISSYIIHSLETYVQNYKISGIIFMSLGSMGILLSSYFVLNKD